MSVSNVEVTGAARLYRAASVLTAGLAGTWLPPNYEHRTMTFFVVADGHVLDWFSDVTV